MGNLSVLLSAQLEINWLMIGQSRWARNFTISADSKFGTSRFR